MLGTATCKGTGAIGRKRHSPIQIMFVIDVFPKIPPICQDKYQSVVKRYATQFAFNYEF
jgi:hypothetical protein